MSYFKSVVPTRTTKSSKCLKKSIPYILLVGLAVPAHASLLGFWTFDDGSGTTVSDVSGNGNNGTLSSTGATWATGIAGGGAISLSFANDGFVSMGNPSALALGDSAGDLATFTVQAWINTTSSNPPAPAIVGEQINGTNQGYLIAAGNFDPGSGCTNSTYNGKAAGYISSGGGGCFGVEITPPSTTTVTDGNWHQLVMVDNNGTLSIYVDGSLQGTGSNPNGTLACPGADFVVGGGTSSGSCGGPGTPIGGYTGLITDVGVWNQALTSSQVLAAFQSPNNPNAALTTSGTPEPASFGLGALGLGALCVIARRRHLNPTRRSRSIMRASS